jgi:hypothetical protein
MSNVHSPDAIGDIHAIHTNMDKCTVLSVYLFPQFLLQFKVQINGYWYITYCSWLKFLCKYLKGHDDITVSFE